MMQRHQLRIAGLLLVTALATGLVAWLECARESGSDAAESEATSPDDSRTGHERPPGGYFQVTAYDGPPPLQPVALAFYILYGVTPPPGKTSIQLPRNQDAALYYRTDVRTEAGLRHLVLIRRRVPEHFSHADGATLDAVSLRREGRRWVVEVRADNLTSIGNSGTVELLQGTTNAAKVEQHPVGHGHTGVFLPDSATEMGQNLTVLTGIGVAKGELRELGVLLVSDNNHGICQPEVDLDDCKRLSAMFSAADRQDCEERLASSICYEWHGRLSVRARPGQWSDLIVTRRGTNYRGVKPDEVVYRWSEQHRRYMAPEREEFDTH